MELEPQRSQVFAAESVAVLVAVVDYQPPNRDAPGTVLGREGDQGSGVVWFAPDVCARPELV